MAPQRFGSVSQKTRQTTRLPSLRDDTGLLALRYEQTKQAEPPIPLPPPRNPRRVARPDSTVPSPSGSPLVIAPPPVPPPQEEHPLFRRQTPRFVAQKRDSGLTPTSSSLTIKEECEHCENSSVYEKSPGDISGASSIYSDGRTGASPDLNSSFDCYPPPLRVSTVARRPQTPECTIEPADAISPSRSSSLTQRLGKSFSIRSVGKNRLRKKPQGVDKVASGVVPSPVMRGSPKFPDSPKFNRASQSDMGLDTASPQSTDNEFIPISTPIPEDSLWDDLGHLSFSKRGSIMFGGRTDPLAASFMTRPEKPATSSSAAPVASESAGVMPGAGDVNKAQEAPVAVGNDESQSVPRIQVVSMDVEKESQKVRSLYESGDTQSWQDGGRVSFGERLEPTEEVPSDEEENVASSPSASPSHHGEPGSSRTHTTATPHSASSCLRRDSQIRREFERAGGLEDWEDLEGAEVDRYGFINPKRPTTRADTPESKSVHFSSTRKRNVLTKRPGSSYSSSPLGLRPPSRKVSARSLRTFSSELSAASRKSTRSSIRAAVNKLPHNKNRRWMDEAGAMLALPPGLADPEDEKKKSKAAETMKRKEGERSEKWRKMAKVSKKGQQGEGNMYDFDTKNPKLIERTWKGIPDCWRAAAWYSFLESSARHWNAQETDDQLMAEFGRLQNLASPDDVQIDLDVPRTVNGHVMFRKRYRGGQRLLFRVLHAISLFFPEVGYVQGMASLAATLLCYFDEERSFVMMVWLWRYRGLERLYSPGFGGLMAALHDFERRWLKGKDVAAKLIELGIDPTAYGTRWYLTLFNLSIPFPAQLRIWDVFMLLGDCDPGPGPESTILDAGGGGGGGGAESVPSAANEMGQGATKKAKPAEKQKSVSFAPMSPTNSIAQAITTAPPKGLDVLHAASTALMDALREVLLDSDFEVAMKALTAWIPIEDEDFLMKVAKAEWAAHQHHGGHRSGASISSGFSLRKKDKEKAC
ncbi:USP6 N-terminal-like protein [Rhypophila decipiens]|uniref:USP6 N-terminal-like protein n=1 Tax=Rhypophila decipiens TaxID=261697 RepID=A0AAN7B6U2_9PEZI|nr:USP6 N-terminal-like protein [Rhypophila decipiens]